MLRNTSFRQVAGILLIFSLAPTTVVASDDPSPWDLRLFGTIGMATSTARHADFVRDLSQADGVSASRWSGKLDSMLGAQASYVFDDTLTGTVQAVSRYRNDRSWTPDLTWANLSYTPGPGTQLRAGRLGTDFYLQADSRFVGYSYLSVRPSGDYFGTLPFYSIDGADASQTLRVGQGLLKGKIFAGVTHGALPLENDQWNINGSLMTGANLSYQLDNWTWRLGYAQLRHAHDVPLVGALLARGVPTPIAAVVADSLAVDGKLSRYYSADAVFDRGPFQAQLSISRILQENQLWPDSWAGYLLASYRLGELTPYAGISRVRTGKQTVATGNPFADVIAATVVAWNRSWQDTYTLGLRWDFHRNMDFKAQWDAVRGRPDSVFPVRWETTEWTGRTNVFSLTLDFAF